jgi:hypothetical protein
LEEMSKTLKKPRGHHRRSVTRIPPSPSRATNGRRFITNLVNREISGHRLWLSPLRLAA